jgi:hypothetical protein
MYFGEGAHSARPHFHAFYAGASASFDVTDLTRLAGRLPLRTEQLVRKWARVREPELLANWERGRKGLPLKAIEPLK